MVEQAEQDGQLRPGDTIVEPTSGNTGIGLALIAAVKGYELILTMPDTMSEERRRLLAAYGATLELTPDTKGMHAAIQRANEIAAQQETYFIPQQFNNSANPEAHRRTTAIELLQQHPHIDAFVTGVGTGEQSQAGKPKTPSSRYTYYRSRANIIFSVEWNHQGTIRSRDREGFVLIHGTEIYDEIITVSDEEAVSTQDGCT
jgi:cysteine synthase A